MGRGWKRARSVPRQSLTRQTAFDELKTHLRGAQIVLRSKTPDLVRQEFYGLLMAHFAVRGLMHEAALSADEDPPAILPPRCARRPPQDGRLRRYFPLGAAKRSITPCWRKSSTSLSPPGATGAIPEGSSGR